MSFTTRNTLIAAVTCVAAAAVAVVLVATGVLHGRRHAARPHAAPTPTSNGPKLTSNGPKPPVSGAWLGAWVSPGKLATQQHLVRAYQRFERTVGHRMRFAHTYYPWASRFPRSSDRYFLSHGDQLLISWGGADTRAIASGRYDGLIRQRAESIKALHHPVLLSWRGEMDRRNLRAQMHSGGDYVAAWRHIRKIFDRVGTRNVGWVWCPTAQGFATGRAAAYYPGDGQVDWVGVDEYADAAYRPFGSDIRPFLRWAKGHPGKPIVIAEFGARDGEPGQRDRWLRGVAAAAKRNPRIKALSYFDANIIDKNGHPMSFAMRGSAWRTFGSLLRDRYFNPAPGGAR